MGQKVNPIGYRLGVNKTWESKWYAKSKDFGDTLNKDIKIRKYISKNLKDAAVASVIIERKKDKCEVTINTAKPGVIIGRGGEDMQKIEKRAPFRSPQNRDLRNTMKAGAKGIKTSVSGRLAGAEMARTEGYTEGTVPLHTLRADIDYAHSEADTTYGKIGVKVWIYKGEILPTKKNVKESVQNVDAKKN